MVPKLTYWPYYRQNGKVSPDVHHPVLAATTLRMVPPRQLAAALWDHAVVGLSKRHDRLHAYLYIIYGILTDNQE